MMSASVSKMPLSSKATECLIYARRAGSSLAKNAASNPSQVKREGSWRSITGCGTGSELPPKMNIADRELVGLSYVV